MENLKQVACSENEQLAAYMWNKRKEMAQGDKGISDNVDSTLYKAYSNVCNCKHPLKTLKDLSQIKGVGKWILKQMKGFFGADSDPPEDDLNIKANKKQPRRYVPQKNSVAYALLISLYRGTENGAEYMHKKELIDAAETSGLSRVPIAPEKAKGKGGHFGSSPRDWYSGWSCMKTLVTRGLVVKSSCPAKYMLTEEGKEVARECLLRSGLTDPNKSLHSLEKHSNLNQNDLLRVEDLPASECDIVASSEKVVQPSTNLKKQKILHVPPEFLEKFLGMGFSQQQINRAYSEVTETSQRKDISSLWPSVLCRLREDEIYGRADFCASENVEPRVISTSSNQKSSIVHDLGRNTHTLKACSSTVQDHAINKLNVQGLEPKPNTLAVPPLTFGEKFGDAYEVVLILDNREQFATQGSRSRKIIDGICSQFQIKIEIRRLPVGDCVWIARHKYIHSEYVLDFIVERKKVDDLRHSIRDNRYKDQKLRLLRCGLKKMIYLLEGDPNSSEAAESIKTACFTTEILEGFDVQRTSGLADTLRKYGFLTQAINQYYRSLDPELKNPSFCPPFDEFIKRCEELDKMRVSDVFAVQLMQVPHVTEDVALAVIDLYPTLLSLAHAYAIIEGDLRAQEEMLTKQSNNLINAQASKNIFQLIWGD